MKKTIARIMILLMVLNIGVFKGSYANGESPVPLFVNSTETEATFKYDSDISGKLYYMVTTEDIVPSPEDVKATALTGVISPALVAKGSINVAHSEGTLSISGLNGKNYTLHTTFQHGNTFEAVTSNEFTALGYELTPTITVTDTNKMIVKTKLNNSGFLYYGVYKDGTGITAMNLVNALDPNPQIIDPNRVYGEKKIVTNGVEITAIIPFIDKNQAYDLVFVKKDSFGNVSHTVQTLNDKRAAKTQLLNAAYIYQGDETGQSSVYLYFKDDIVRTGDNSNYTITFKKDGAAEGYTVGTGNFEIITSGSATNIVELSLDSDVHSELLTWDNNSGTMTVTVNNLGGFAPLAAVNYQTSIFVMPAESYNSTAGSMMKSASYEYTGLGEVVGDSIAVTMDSPMYDVEVPNYTTPAAVNFDLSVVGLDVPFVAEDDYKVVLANPSHFNIIFTTGGAVKLAMLPTSVMKITVNNGANGSWFKPYANEMYVPRLSSNSTLASMELYGRPIALTPGTKEYTVSVPYSLLDAYNSTPAAALKVIPSDPQSYVTILPYPPNGIHILVMSADGADGNEDSISNYTIYAQPNELTLAGISINGQKVSSFDHYATSYAYTITEPITSEPLLTVAHSEHVTATITSVLSPSIANAYVYTVILRTIGSETSATYTVTVTGGPVTPVTPPVDNNGHGKDKENNGNGNGNGNSNANSGTATPNVDPTTEINSLINLPTENLTGQNITNNMKNIEIAMDEIRSDKQAFDTLTKMDDLVKKVSDSMTNNPTEKKELSTMVTQMTTKMEEKLSMIDNPENRMVVLDQFLTEIKLFKTKAGEPMTTMDKSVEDMVQKTANAFGTIKLEAAAAGEAIKIDDKMLASVIEKQTEALKKLTQIQQTYFDTSATRTIKKEIKIESSLAGSAAMLKVDLAANQVGTLKDAKIDSVTISNVSAEIKLPVSNLKPTESAQVAIEKMPTVLPSNIGSNSGPKLVYDVGFLINNVAQQKFSKPITLAFNLTTFELQKESPLELSIFKLNTQTNVWEAVGGIVDPESFKIFVTRDNLSQYTVLKSKKSFSDADQSWAKAEINALLNKGIVSETAKFEPQSALTRGEFAQWIAKAYGLKVSDQNLPFKDVAKSGASFEAIAAVYQQGILTGKSKTKFDPSGKVTQNEMAAVLGKLLVSFDNKEKSGKVTSKYLSQLKTTQVASWAEDDMALLMELGLNISGKNGGEPLTKEAAASAFIKFYRS